MLHMRSIVNISLPVELNLEVEKEVDYGRFASKSEFFRHLLRLWLGGKLSQELEESHEELLAGKGNLLKSLKVLR